MQDRNNIIGRPGIEGRISFQKRRLKKTFEHRGSRGEAPPRPPGFHRGRRGGTAAARSGGSARNIRGDMLPGMAMRSNSSSFNYSECPNRSPCKEVDERPHELGTSLPGWVADFVDFDHKRYTTVSNISPPRGDAQGTDDDIAPSERSRKVAIRAKRVCDSRPVLWVGTLKRVDFAGLDDASDASQCRRGAREKAPEQVALASP